MLVKKSGLPIDTDGCNHHKPNCYNRLCQPVARFNSCHRRGSTTHIFCNTLAMDQENYNSIFRTALELNDFILSTLYETPIPLINTSQHQNPKTLMNYGSTHTIEQNYDSINADNDPLQYYFTLPDVIENLPIITLRVNNNKPISQAQESVDKSKFEAVVYVNYDKDNILTVSVDRKFPKIKNDNISLQNDCENFSISESDSFPNDNKPSNHIADCVNKTKHGNANVNQIVNEASGTDFESNYVTSDMKPINREEENLHSRKQGHGNFINGTKNYDHFVNQATKTGKGGKFLVPETDYGPYGIKPNNQSDKVETNKHGNGNFINGTKNYDHFLNQATKTGKEGNFSVPEADYGPYDINQRDKFETDKHGNGNFINGTKNGDQFLNEASRTDNNEDNNELFGKLNIPNSNYVNSNKKPMNQGEENVDTRKQGHGNFINGTRNDHQIVDKPFQAEDADNSVHGKFTIPEADYVPYGKKPINEHNGKGRNKSVNDADNDKNDPLIVFVENKAFTAEKDINLLSSENFSIFDSDTIPVGTNSKPLENDSTSLVPLGKSGNQAMTSITTPTNLPLGDEEYVIYTPTNSVDMPIHSARNKVNAETQSASSLFNIPPMKSVSTNIVTHYESTSAENATITHQN